MPGSVIGVHQFPVSVAAYAPSLQSVISALGADVATLVTVGYDVLPAWLANVSLSARDAATEQAILQAAQSVLGSLSGQGSVLPTGVRAMNSAITAIVTAGSATAAQVDAVANALAAAAQSLNTMLANLPNVVQGTPDDAQSIDSLVTTAQTDLKPVVTDLYAQAATLSSVSQQMVGESALGGGGTITQQPPQPPSQQKKPSTSVSVAAVLGSVAVIAGIGFGIHWISTHPHARAA